MPSQNAVIIVEWLFIYGCNALLQCYVVYMWLQSFAPMSALNLKVLKLKNSNYDMSPLII